MPIISSVRSSPPDTVVIVAILLSSACLLSVALTPLPSCSKPDDKSVCVLNGSRGWGIVFASPNEYSSASWAVARACVNKEVELDLGGWVWLHGRLLC
jgi:hypothetical protein